MKRSKLHGSFGLTRSPDPAVNRLRENNFDVVRLVLASMVLLFHVGLLSDQPSLAWMYTWISSTFAVQAFFVVSGFLVTMSYDRSGSLRSYARKRALRILPPYVMVVLAAAIGLCAISTLGVGDYFSSAEWRHYVVRNLMLSNFEAPTLPGVFRTNPDAAVNGSLWTIKVEVAFYCFVPIAFWCMRKVGRDSFLAFIFVASIAWKLGFELAAVHTGVDLYARLAKQLPGQLAFFAGGAYAYLRTRRGLSLPSHWLAIVAVLGYCVADGAAYTIFSPLFVTIFVYWATIGAPVLPNPLRGGDYSYGIYLYHFPIAQLFIALGFFAISPLLATVGVCAIAAMLAYASWHLLEKRCLAIGHRRPSTESAGTQELAVGQVK